MAIYFNVEDIDFELQDEDKVKRWIKTTITSRGFRVGNISYLFCSDEHLYKVNVEFLNHDTYTDIITFDYVNGNLVSGDILISVDRVRDNARQFGVSFDQELLRVIIHGIHHLLGQGDKTEIEAKEMRQKEAQSLLEWEVVR